MNSKSLYQLLMLVILALLIISNLTAIMVPATRENQYLSPEKDYLSIDEETILLSDDFEEYTVNDFPDEGGWIILEPGKSLSEQKIVDNPAIDLKSLQLWGTDQTPATIAHEINTYSSQFTLAYYVDIMIYIDENTGSNSNWFIEASLNGTPLTIKVREDGVTVAGYTVTNGVPNGWVRVAAAYSPQTGHITAWANAETITTQTTTINTTPTKLVIKTNTKTYIDNVKTKQIPTYTTFWKSGTGYYTVRSVSWNPDDSRLVIGTGHSETYDYGKVVVFDSSGNKLWEKSLGGYVFSVDWSPDGSMLAVGTANNMVFVFDAGGNLIWWRGLGGKVWSIAWSPSGDKIAMGVDSNVVVFSIGVGLFGVSGSFVSGDSLVFSVYGFPGCEYCWEFGDGYSACTSVTDLTYSYSEGGWYNVTLIVERDGVVARKISQWIYVNQATTTTTATSTTTTTTATTPTSTATTTTSQSIPTSQPITTTATETVTEEKTVTQTITLTAGVAETVTNTETVTTTIPQTTIRETITRTVTETITIGSGNRLPSLETIVLSGVIVLIGIIVTIIMSRFGR